jgi:hypothetical protein
MQRNRSITADRDSSLRAGCIGELTTVASLAPAFATSMRR